MASLHHHCSGVSLLLWQSLCSSSPQRGMDILNSQGGSMVAWMIDVVVTVWQQDIFGCSMVGIAIVMIIIVTTSIGMRLESKEESDPGAMNKDELEEKLEELIKKYG
jgi:hypothetical protein